MTTATIAAIQESWPIVLVLRDEDGAEASFDVDEKCDVAVDGIAALERDLREGMLITFVEDPDRKCITRIQAYSR